MILLALRCRPSEILNVRCCNYFIVAQQFIHVLEFYFWSWQVICGVWVCVSGVWCLVCVSDVRCLGLSE